MASYTVQQGDTLSGIAAKQLGSASRWRELGFTGDPTKLPVGTVLNFGAPAPAVGSNPNAAPGTPGGVDPAMAGVGNQVASPNSPVIGANGIATSPTQIQNLDQAKSFINADQNNIIEAASAPEVRGSGVSGIQQRQKEVEAAITTSAGTAPAAPSFEQNYSALRDKYGVGDLEGGLTNLQNEQAMLEEQLKNDIAAERAKTGVAQGVIEGRVNELSKAAQLKLSDLGTKIANTTNLLKTKYDVVNSLMKFKEMDYGAAVDDYTRKYNAAIQSFNVAKGIEEEAKSEADRAKDDARANLQIITNAIKDNGLGEVSPEQKILINKLEMQAGLPVGITEQFQAKNPKSDILTSNEWTDPSGKQYIAFVSRDESGKLKTENVFIGQGKAPTGGGGGGGTQTERENADASLVANQLESVTGSDGYISPDNYLLARRKWVNAGYSAKDFDERFYSTYANPDILDQYRLTIE